MTDAAERGALGEVIDRALQRLEADEGDFAIFAIAGTRNRYVQVVRADDTLLGEAVSNQYLAGDELDDEDLDTLRTLGWHLAPAGSDRNHERIWASWRAADRSRVVQDVAATLSLAYGLAPDGRVDVTVDA
jgi:hypothetical protein